MHLIPAGCRVEFPQTLKGYRPVIAHLFSGYRREHFLADLGAGLTVGIIALPLSIGFAIASGVKPEQGLWTAIIAGIKLILPMLIVIPGMMAVQILGEKLDPSQMDKAYPMLMKELLPVGALGLMIAAVAGSIMSTFNSGLNSAATVFTLDLWSVYVRRDMTEKQYVACGRNVTAILAIAACLWAPAIRSFDGVFGYIQEFWGFVSAPTAAVFFAGLLMRRVPAAAARTAFIAGPLFYLASRSPSWIWNESNAIKAGGLVEALWRYSSLSFLYHMFILFVLLVGMMGLWGMMKPLPEAAMLPDRPKIDMQRWRGSLPVGLAVIAVTVAIYILLW